jgi:hypothetical protein
MKRIWVCAIALLVCGLIEAQPEAKFHSEKAKVGELIELSLSLTHDGSRQWIFPDSTSNFAPFEWVSKKVFPTQELGPAQYRDSAVYTLRTFEIDTVLTLKTAVVGIEADSLFCVSNPITIVSSDLPPPKDSPLYINTLLLKLSFLLNYPLFVAVGLSLLVILGLVWALFGKKIRLYFKIRRLEKERIKFLYRFDSLLSESPSKVLARDLLALWKGYCAAICGLPLPNLTAKETALALKKMPWAVSDELLSEPLRQIDLAIYAGKISASFQDDFKKLRQIALDLHQIHLIQLKS